jgi:uncharacterized DUF497 family protein
MSFQWDERKAKANLKKHGVSFEEASTVFRDPGLRLLSDMGHSVEEERFAAIGSSRLLRTLVVSYCYRGDVIRIISARKAAPSEVKQHFGD